MAKIREKKISIIFQLRSQYNRSRYTLTKFFFFQKWYFRTLLIIIIPGIVIFFP